MIPIPPVGLVDMRIVDTFLEANFEERSRLGLLDMLRSYNQFRRTDGVDGFVGGGRNESCSGCFGGHAKHH